MYETKQMVMKIKVMSFIYTGQHNQLTGTSSLCGPENVFTDGNYIQTYIIEDWVTVFLFRFHGQYLI